MTLGMRNSKKLYRKVLQYLCDQLYYMAKSVGGNYGRMYSEDVNHKGANVKMNRWKNSFEKNYK